MGEYADMALEQMIDNMSSWGPSRRVRTITKRNAALRIKAHQAFDPIWKSGKMTRSEAYTWLAREMGLRPRDCHMEQMNSTQCERVIELCGPLAFENLDQ